MSRGATAKFNALDLAYGVKLPDGSIPGPLSDWSATVTVEKDRHGLLDTRNDREALFHPLGDGGALTLDIAELVGASHRLSATNPISLIVDQIAGLDPAEHFPPASICGASSMAVPRTCRKSFPRSVRHSSRSSTARARSWRRSTGMPSPVGA